MLEVLEDIVRVPEKYPLKQRDSIGTSALWHTAELAESAESDIGDVDECTADAVVAVDEGVVCIVLDRLLRSIVDADGETDVVVAVVVVVVADIMEPEKKVWNRHPLATVSPCFG